MPVNGTACTYCTTNCTVATVNATSSGSSSSNATSGDAGSAGTGGAGSGGSTAGGAGSGASGGAAQPGSGTGGSTPAGTGSGTTTAPSLNYDVHVFYYPWYSNVATDGHWLHWTQNGHSPPDDIASDFYPYLGPYSSDNATTLDQQMSWIADAGIGVIVYSWWGQGSFEDQRLLRTMDAAGRHDIKVAFHIEPYSGRTASSVVSDIRYIIDTYGANAAFYRVSKATRYGNTTAPRPVFYVFESSGGAGAIPASAQMPFTSFPTNYNDLPDVSFVIPNLDDDMHDGSISQGDTWLRNNIDGYVQWARTHNSLLIVTYDEGSGGNQRIYTVFSGQNVT